MAVNVTHQFSAGGRKPEVRTMVNDGSFRADVWEVDGAKRRATPNAGVIERDVLGDMSPTQQREAKDAIVQAMQDAVKNSYQEG